jgi:nucleotide-binding universal stress UspA family protein
VDRSVLVPLDGSPFGEQALPAAISLARRAGVELQLVNVLPPLASVYTEAPLFVNAPVGEQLRDRQVKLHQAYLEQQRNRIVPLYSAVRTTLLEGEVAATLWEQANRNASLVVMTTHGRGPLGRFWLGSVADELIRHSHVPILLIRPREEAPDLKIAPNLRHFLVPLDGTELAEQMLGPAVQFGGLVKADFTLLRVIQPILATTPPMLEGPTFGHVAEALIAQTEAMQEQVRQEAQAYLEKLAQPLREKGLTVLTRVDVDDQPAHAILEESKTVDVVALATHGRRGLARLFLGSVADKVIRASHTAVLVLRPSNE